MRKTALRWGVALVVLLVLTAGVLRGIQSRRAQQAQLAQPAAPVEAAIVLGPGDVVRAGPKELTQGLAISGTLRALDSAIVKARVAGELRGLTVREGDSVQAGQVVARIEAVEYEARVAQAREQAASAAAQAEVARRTFDNNKALVDQGFISRSALDTSQSNLNAALATHRAALAAVDVARKSLEDTVLRSPIAGLVSQRLVQPGERVGIDTRVLEVLDLRRLELEAALSPADSLAVRVGQRARLQIEGRADAADAVARTVDAEVVRINPSAQAGSRNVLVYLRLDRAEGLRQGLFAQGRLDTGRVQAVSVPLSAVRVDKPEPYVQLVRERRVVHQRVQPGARGLVEGQTWVAAEGVPDGAMVLGSSVGTLAEGTPVRLGAGLAP